MIRGSVITRFASFVAAMVLLTTALSVTGGVILSKLAISRATEVAAMAVDAQLTLVLRAALLSGDASVPTTALIMSQIATQTPQSQHAGDVFYRLEITPGVIRAVDSFGAELPPGVRCPAKPTPRGESPASPVHWRTKGPQPLLISCLTIAGAPTLTIYAGQRIDTQTGLVWRAALALGLFQLVLLGTFGSLIAVSYRRRIQELNEALAALQKGQWKSTADAADAPDELGGLARSVAGAARATTEHIEQLESITGAIAHEYRGRLTHVRQAVEDAYRRAPTSPERTRELLRDAGEGLGLLETEFNDFLTLLRRYAESPDRDSFRRIEVRLLIEQVVEPYLARFRDRGLKVTIDIPADAAILAIGGGLLVRHTVENLVGNALKYAAQGGDLSIRWRREEDRFTVSFANSDAGEATEPTARLLEPGVRGADTDSIAGHGIGLSLAIRFCRLDGLQLRIERRPGLFLALVTGEVAPSSPTCLRA